MNLAPIAEQQLECATKRDTIGSSFHVASTFDLPPPSGRVALGARFPGLKSG
jgi:hypothetical protein